MNILKFFLKKKKKNIINRGENNIFSHIPRGLKISIWGNNNRIEIDSSVQYFKGCIAIGDSSFCTNNTLIRIGKNCSSNGVNIVLYEDNSTIEIGDDCMFSWNIAIWNSDSHSIFDKNSKKLLNIGKKIKIEDHVWVGMNSVILKNTQISSNSIIAANAVVTKPFLEENVIIAGNPARIVKNGINWDRERPCAYLKEENHL